MATLRDILRTVPFILVDTKETWFTVTLLVINSGENTMIKCIALLQIAGISMRQDIAEAKLSKSQK